MLLAAEGYRRRAGLASATALAAATLVKLTPATLLLGWALGEPGPRVRAFALRFVLAGAGLVLLSLPLAPPVHWEQFVAALGEGSPWRSPYSWWGWLALEAERTPALLAWRWPLYLAGAALLLGLAAWRLRRVARADVPVEGAAAGLVLGLLLSPLTWQHHYLFFLLPAYAWVAGAWAERRTGLALALASCAALVLLRLPGAWLMVRPLATLAAFTLVAWSSRDARPAETATTS
jgi:alpha-1,2-mannosyltransferase